MYSAAALYVLGAGAYATGYNVIGPMIFAAEDAKLNAAARATAALENQGRPAPGTPCKTEAGGGGDKARVPPGGVAEAGEDDEPQERGSLTAAERAQIQEIANRFNTRIDVVGSRAAGLGRNIGSDLPVGKGPGTRSDIDFIIDGQVDIETRGALTDALREVGNGAGSVISPRGFSSPPNIVFTPRGR